MNSSQVGFVGGCRTRSHCVSNVGLGKMRSGRYSMQGGNQQELSQSNHLLKKIESSQNQRLEKIKSRLNKKIKEGQIKVANRPSLQKKSGPIIRKKAPSPIEKMLNEQGLFPSYDVTDVLSQQLLFSVPKEECAFCRNKKMQDDLIISLSGVILFATVIAPTVQSDLMSLT